MSQAETPAAVFCSTNVAFRKNHPIKFEILTLCLADTKFKDFFLGEIGNQVVFFPPNFPWRFSVITLNSCHSFWRNQCTFYKNQFHQIWNFNSLACWNEIHRFFPSLNWKPVLTFPPNLPWPFSVTRWDSCHSLLVNRSTFYRKQSHESWNFDPLARCNKIHRFFFRLNWKPVITFPPNFPWPFNVIKSNSYDSF